MKSIRFCKSYQINKVRDSSTIIDRLIYLLNQSKYITEKDNNKIYFKRHSNYTTHRFDNSAEVFIILKSGTVFFNFEKNIIKICWIIKLNAIYFRSLIFGLLVSLCYYFYFSKDILNTIIILLSVFVVVSLISIIILKERTIFYNNSVLST